MGLFGVIFLAHLTTGLFGLRSRKQQYLPSRFIFQMLFAFILFFVLRDEFAFVLGVHLKIEVSANLSEVRIIQNLLKFFVLSREWTKCRI